MQRLVGLADTGHWTLYWKRELELRMPHPTSSDFFLLLWRPPSDTHSTDMQPSTMMNFRRAAPPWRHLIIEKNQETYSFFILPPRLPSVPPTLISPAVSGVSACCRLHSGGVHVSRSGGSAALFCALVHRITALDNRVVVEGESGAGPGAGPGEAPWLFIARSPKSCASFFYSSF